MAKSNYEKNMESLPKDEVNDLSLDEQGDSINGIKEQFGCLADNLNRKPNYFQMKEKENLRLERLIKVLTELYLLQSGKAELYMDEVNLTFLLREVVERLGAKANQKMVNLTLNDPGNELVTYCDGKRIKQMLDILLDNAIKYTPAYGLVNITLTDEGDKICITVSDTGCGIPEEDLLYIFDKFYKVNKSRNHPEDEGLGLGLSIAKVIAELHETEINVVSRLGQGSKFTVCLRKANN